MATIKNVKPKDLSDGIDLQGYLGGPSKPFFRAKDIKGSSTKVTIKAIRESSLPETGATIVMDFVFKKEDRSLPLNKTNLKKLREIQGGGLTLYPAKLVGRQITLYKVMVNNPKLKKEVEGIRIK